MIDLRSDTVTKPTPGMLEAMMSAQVGDDVSGEDPTMNLLQQRMANMFGMEASLFCPSGTMANQIALRINTQPQDEVICDWRSHIYLYEGGGMASNSMLSPKLLDGDCGRINAEMIEVNINPDDIHYPRTKLVSLENTMNKGGGAIYDFEEIRKISKVCKDHHLRLHLDGARLFNALVETGDSPLEYGALFDTISICFSKGLGAPIGSILLGSAQAIAQAKRVRKVFGGGMRQTGYLAAAAIYALDNHIDRLKEDHIHARQIGDAVSLLSFVSRVDPVDTNIVIAYLDGVSPEDVVNKLKTRDILALRFGSDSVRFVTHLGISKKDVDQVLDTLGRINY